jgi:regulation of enolase protein 1 (concanavalin A-like superfamily)
MDVTIPGVPLRFEWIGEPLAALVGDHSLAISARPESDWFIDPETAVVTSNASALVFQPDTDFTLQALVDVSFASTFDAGALVLWYDDRNWAKLCFEFSPQGERMVVSVVTRGASDDCNSVVVMSPSIWLRVACLGDAHAFHYSFDSVVWHFVRFFRFAEVGQGHAGFEVQSPTGQGCEARFSSIAYQQTRLIELRNGS